MLKGIPKNGVNKGWFQKGQKPKHAGNKTFGKCNHCEKKIRVFPSRPARFCDHSCAAKFRWRYTGDWRNLKRVAWNKDLKDIHLSPESEFKWQGKGKQLKGKSQTHWRQRARNKMGLKQGDKLVVHHVDGDITNNKPSNLQVMTRANHTKLHWAQGDIRQ